MGAISYLETLGTSKGEQAPGKARKRHPASLVPSSHRQICEEFRSISRKIYEKPNSIEELAELREWMKGIPEKLVVLEVRHTHGSQRAGLLLSKILVGLEVRWANCELGSWESWAIVQV